MYFDYLNVLIFSAAGLVFVLGVLAVTSLVRPSRKTDVGLETYECGEETIGSAWVRFDIRYYTVALVYVVFAVEIAFLFPWALVLRETLTDTGAAAGAGIGLFGLVEGVLFVAILFLGLVYVWAKGDLEWVLSYSGARWRPPEPDRRVHPATASKNEAERGAEGADASEDATTEHAT